MREQADVQVSAGKRVETIICVWGNNNIRTDASTKRKHYTLPLKASTKRYLKTLPLNATSNGGDASRVGKVATFIH